MNIKNQFSRPRGISQLPGFSRERPFNFRPCRQSFETTRKSQSYENVLSAALFSFNELGRRPLMCLQTIPRSAHLHGRPRWRLVAGSEADGWSAADEASALGGRGGFNALLAGAGETGSTGADTVTGTPSRRKRSMSRSRVRAALS
jgi:hypothetical protein